MDYLVGLYLKTKASFAALLILTIIYLVVWFAWLCPTFPYPGVSWNGEPWVNFREWVRLTLAYLIICVVILSFRNKWERDKKGEEARRYGPATTVAQAEKKESIIGIDEAIKKAAREAAEEATKEEKEGGEK